MTLEQLLKNTARRCGIPYDTILKDYAIGYVLSALTAEPAITDTLITCSPAPLLKSPASA